MNCDQWREDVSAWVDGELAPARWLEVEAHLKVCRDCRRLAGQFEKLTRLARGAAMPRAGAQLTEPAMALVRAGEIRAGARWRPAARMLWPHFGLAAAGLAAAGLLAFVATRDGSGQFSLSAPAGGQDRVAAASGPAGQAPTANASGPARLRTEGTLAAIDPAVGRAPCPPIVGNLIVNSSAVGAERLATLARSLGGTAAEAAAPDQATVYVSIPENARPLFKAGLAEIGSWQDTPAPSPGAADAIIGIRIIQRR